MKTLVIVCILFFFSGALMSQEIQVPFDSKGTIMILDKDWNKKTKAFSQSNFQEARIYKINDSTFSLEVIRKEGYQWIRDRKVMNASEYDDFQLNFDQYISSNADSVDYPNEGRVKLVFSNTLTGLAYYGWAIPMSFDVNDTRTSVGLYMLTGGLSFYLPFALTRKSNITYAEATAWYYGQTRGIAHFAPLPLIKSESPDFKSVLALGMAGSILEAFSYYSIAKNYNLSNGQVHAINTYADFGLLNGLMFSFYSNLVKEAEYGFVNDEYTIIKEGSHSAIPLCLLAGSGIGYTSGYFLSKNNRYTVGDAYATYGSGLLGGYLALSVNNMANTSNENVIVGTMAAGTIIGLAGGHVLSNYSNYTQSQGTLIILGSGASALFGLGCGYLISPENPRVWSGFSAVGAAGGGVLMNYLFFNKSKTKKISLIPSIEARPLYAYQPGSAQARMVPGLAFSIKF